MSQDMISSKFAIDKGDFGKPVQRNSDGDIRVENSSEQVGKI